MMNNSHANEKTNAIEFEIQRIYVKDASFEAPNTPEIFRGEWNPEVDMDLNSIWKKLEEYIYEVVVNVTITAKNFQKIAFITEVQQAGIFTIPNLPEEQLDGILNSLCPSIIFPYLRETVADLVNRGSFPPLHLAPINFDALYLRHLEQKKKQMQEETPDEQTGGKTH